MLIITIKQAYSMLSNAQRKQWLIVFGAAAISSAVELFSATQIVRFAKALNDSTVEISLCVLVGSAFLVKNAFSVVEIYWQNKILTGMSHSFKDKILRHYVFADSHEKFVRADMSYFTQIISNDIDNMFYWGFNSMALAFSELIVFGAFFCLIIYYNWMAAIGLGVLGAIAYMVLFKWLSPLISKWGKNMQEARSVAVSELTQIFDAFTSIIMFGMGNRFINEYNVASKQACNMQAKLGTIRMLPRLVLESLVMSCFIIGIIVLCMYDMITTELCGLLGGFVYIGLRMASAAARVMSSISSFEAVAPSINRLWRELQ